VTECTNLDTKLCNRCHTVPRDKVYVSYCRPCGMLFSKESRERHKVKKPRLPPGYKFCTECDRLLPVTNFYAANRNGVLRGKCKDCVAIVKRAQRDPNWMPSCCRCDTKLPVRVNRGGRRLCASCFETTYDLNDVREQGSHRIKLKACSLCGGQKERFERGKLCSACKPWEPYAKSLRRFGLTPADYTEMLSAQDGVCYVCKILPNGERLRIDHDHSLPEGRRAVRGLLCNECNYSRLPRFFEDAEMLSRAAEYLRNPPARAILTRTSTAAVS
jgi:hypothetical protein